LLPKRSSSYVYAPRCLSAVVAPEVPFLVHGDLRK